jgi:hypothetical protein
MVATVSHCPAWASARVLARPSLGYPRKNFAETRVFFRRVLISELSRSLRLSLMPCAACVSVLFTDFARAQIARPRIEREAAASTRVLAGRERIADCADPATGRSTDAFAGHLRALAEASGRIVDKDLAAQRVIGRKRYLEFSIARLA